ncbi:MAG: serine hydrolase domain-containing protein, partial [Wenzhouxiangella sp.]|nr:serine hydrolase domain-containing protein [Wenzhouxiangella sp.]
QYFAGTLEPGSTARPDENTAYAIGSISKAFTNLMLAERVASGALSYETTLGDLLGDEVEFSNPAVASITLQALATHTSGLPRLPGNLQVMANPQDPYADYGSGDLLEALESARALQPLGSHYAYSNFGLGLLGWLLGREAGSDYGSALDAAVIGPLGLSATGLTPDDDAASAFAQGQPVPAWTFDALAGAGALWSSTADLMQLAEFLLGLRSSPLVHDLADDLVALDEAGEFRVTRVWHQAQTASGPLFWHNGGTAGHRSFFAFRPATDEALVVLIAGGLDPTSPGLRAFDFEPYENAAAAKRADLHGQYRFSADMGLGVFDQDGRLQVQLSGQAPLTLSSIGDDLFALDVVDASLRFIREDDAVVAVELIQNGRIQRADRVAERAAVLARETIELEGEALDDYIGQFALTPQLTFVVRRGGEAGLEVQVTGQPFVSVYPAGDDVFFYKVVDAELHFQRDDQDRVDALVLHQGAIEQRAERIEQ